MTAAAHPYDCITLGAGAAGLFQAGRSAQLGQRVLVLDHAAKPAEKVRISGGGRCNFTNIHTTPENFISQNPHFAKSALARYTPWDFCDLIASHDITWHEKTLGQLFCDGKSGAIITMLLAELEKGGGDLKLSCSIRSVSHADGTYSVTTDQGVFTAPKLVIATGGLSIPKMGATGLAYEIARQFGHEVLDTAPALVPFTFSGQMLEDFASLSGVSCRVRARAGDAVFQEGMLFTHRGLSGPAMLQISSYWTPGEVISVSLTPMGTLTESLLNTKAAHPKQAIGTVLTPHLPARLVPVALAQADLTPTETLADLSHAKLEHLAQTLSEWQLKPTGTEGYRTAEVTVGGIDTAGLSSKTMESKTVPGLHFIGECVDVTGWLGGYNFQWAWASGAAAA